MLLVLLHAVLPALAGAQQGTVLAHKSRARDIEEGALLRPRPGQAARFVGTQKLSGCSLFIQAEGARLAFVLLDIGVGCDQSGKYHLGATPRIEAHWQDSTRLVFHTAVFSIPARKG